MKDYFKLMSLEGRNPCQFCARNEDGQDELLELANHLKCLKCIHNKYPEEENDSVHT
jgi:hypothetical protein